jgi:hypothetical protein
LFPKKGPVSFTVTAVDAAIGAGLSVGPVAFRWPRPLFVTGVILLPTSGRHEDMASLRLRIQDESSQDMISDGAGGHKVSALELCGLRPLPSVFGGLMISRPYALQRPVNTGDQWWITIDNRAAVSLRPELIFTFDDGVK